MNHPMAEVHNEIHATIKRPISDHFGLRRPVIQKPSHMKSTTCIVARVGHGENRRPCESQQD